jgi:hypothetical protein
MKRLLPLMYLLILFCCNREKKITIDDELRLYQDILSELVTRDFYNFYLGEEEVYTLRKKYIDNSYHPDTISYNGEIEKLRKGIELDTSKQRTICFRNKFTVGPWIALGSEVFMDTMNMFQQLRDIIGTTQTELISDSLRMLSDSLRIPQEKYLASDFKSSVFKIGSFTEANRCEIGTIGFSRVFRNTMRDQAILYYEFHCGEKCGKGEILLVEKKNNKWIINKKRRMWIS